MLKIGLIGAGHLGKIHLKIIQEMNQYKLIGFYDAIKEVREEVSKTYNLKAYDNLQALIEDCEVLDIVTPTVSHYEIAKECLKQGKHLFIEKPLTRTLEEGKSLVELSYEAGTKVQVGHVERFNPAFQTAKPFIEKPRFIEVHRLAKYNPRGTDVSVVLDLMIHDIDIILSVVNSSIKRISASGVAVISKTPDICNARIEFDNGTAVNLTASRISGKNMRKARFFQEKKYVLVDYLDKTTKIFGLNNMKDEANEAMQDAVINPWIADEKRIIREKPEVKLHNAIERELDALAESILEDKNTVISVEDGYLALEVAHKIIDKMNSAVGLKVK